MLVKYDLDDKGTGHVFQRNKLVAEERSKFQNVEISDLDILGRVLVLDNIIQLSELDCDRYHEVFAHIPMSNIPDPQSVLILGGGDGILAKELLKYDGLAVDMVDIDERVCALSKEHLTSMHGCSFRNPRLNLVFEDALAFCKRSAAKYDVIFADITDPHPDSPSKSLLSDESISLYKSLLRPGGVLVAQTDNVQIAPQHYLNIAEKFRENFELVGDFATVALTLSSIFSFVWASDSTEVKPADPTPGIELNWLNRRRAEFCFEVLELAIGDSIS
jgi:spermidine synthase